jgi:hypothetical protein
MVLEDSLVVYVNEGCESISLRINGPVDKSFCLISVKLDGLKTWGYRSGPAPTFGCSMVVFRIFLLFFFL